MLSETFEVDVQASVPINALIDQAIGAGIFHPVTNGCDPQRYVWAPGQSLLPERHGRSRIVLAHAAPDGSSERVWPSWLHEGSPDRHARVRMASAFELIAFEMAYPHVARRHSIVTYDPRYRHGGGEYQLATSNEYGCRRQRVWWHKPGDRTFYTWTWIYCLIQN